MAYGFQIDNSAGVRTFDTTRLGRVLHSRALIEFGSITNPWWSTTPRAFPVLTNVGADRTIEVYYTKADLSVSTDVYSTTVTYDRTALTATVSYSCTPVPAGGFGAVCFVLFFIK